ncbi:glycoside hydrolase family 19 protein [Tropicimonas sp. TH_r6]|uniref:glycoside hydrolase family 19 protein n=1 Tax=Tropicimonas sp. TH_r6 TaxID=3082085 RepID=UPI0029556E29|nr:glycoside hydrolase family 19 protein [Tropicimonas sp. TH_r6]MDV7143984.1 glycoside hydrolase family 19 protein [Tropicimonas sp. TH_r6]
MIVDRKVFYQRYRAIFGALSQSQVGGFEAFFDFWDSRSVLTDKRWLAYALATAFHETGRRMQAVREGFCDSDACSVRAVTRLFNQGRISRNYALPHANGNSYFGRGFVQLTHGFNYKRSGQSIGLGNQLYDMPDLALEAETSVKITFVGMLIGSFTGKRLEDYFTDGKSDWKNARKIINGLDKATLIGGYGKSFVGCIEYKPRVDAVPDPDPNPFAETPPPATGLDPSDATAILAEIDRLKKLVEDLSGISGGPAHRAPPPPPDADTVFLPADVQRPDRDPNAWSDVLLEGAAPERVLSYEEYLSLPDDPADATE